MSFEKLQDEFDLEPDHELLEKFKEAQELSDKIEESLKADEHAEFMDKYAEDAKRVFDEIVSFASAVEPRFASELYQAASSLLKLAIDAKNSKKDFALKTQDLSLKERKLALEERKLDLKLQEVNKEKEPEEKRTSTFDKDAIIKAVSQFKKG